jgi:hypothetical protein
LSTGAGLRACSSPTACAVEAWQGSRQHRPQQGLAFTRLAGRTTVPLFILVPQVTVRKRLDVDGAAQK